MSDPAATVPATIRPAGDADAAAVAAAVEELLVELGGRRPPRAELEAEMRAALADPGVGAILVAEAGAEIVGVLSASWQRALHVPGRYATIQDLWVDPDWRSRGVGAALVDELAALCVEAGGGADRGRAARGRASTRSAPPRPSTAGNGFEQLGRGCGRLIS